jgi:hypothetical protein
MMQDRSSTEQTTAFSWLGRLIGSAPQSKAQASAGERRTAPRREVSIAGRVVPEFGRSFACRIIDVSLGGARVRFDGQPPANLATVRLVFLPSGRAHVARVRWREDTEVGLEFVG